MAERNENNDSVMEEQSVETEASIDKEWSREIQRQLKAHSCPSLRRDSSFSGQWPSQGISTSRVRSSKSLRKEIKDVASLYHVYNKTFDGNNYNHGDNVKMRPVFRRSLSHNDGDARKKSFAKSRYFVYCK